MKERIFFFLLPILLLGSAVVTQAQSECDLHINTNFDSDCLLDDYLDFFHELLDLGSDDCMLACKGSTVQYSAISTNGVQYTWNISGSVSSSIDSLNHTISVTWGNGNIGNVAVTVITSDSNICTTETCVLLIESPIAACTTVPAYYIDQSGNKVIEICLGETIEFTDRSSAGRTPITGYLWEDNTGTASSQNHTLTPAQEGEYKLNHCVQNECGCQDCEMFTIRVLPEVNLELSCYGTICENTSVSYSVSSPYCSEYIWNVDGGAFDGQGQSDITVHWGNPPSGYGTISLDSYYCNTECKSLLSVKIPIIVDHAKINGPEEVCVGDVQQYELPMWGSTQYQWWVTPNSNNGIVTHGAEFPNQYLLEFTQPGIYTIESRYVCDFLECGPFNSQKTIIVKDTMSISSCDSVLCKGDTGHFTTWHGNNVAWKVYTQDNQQIHSSNGGSLSYCFVIPGKYKVVASNAGYCKDAEFFVTVLDNPPAITSTQGPGETCPGNSILLTATPSQPNYYLLWEPLCSTATPLSVEGDKVTITYGNEISDVEVYQVDDEYGCRSDAYIHEVDTFRLAPHGLPAITHACAGSTVTMSVPDQSANVTYQWTISPANAASIVGDHLSSSVQILTNHLYNSVSPTIAYVTLKRTYCSNIEVYETVQLYIENVTAPSINFGDSICANSTNYFSATTGTLNNYHYTWIFDGNHVENGHHVSHYYALPGTYHFSLIYRPNPHCDVATVSGQVVVHDRPTSFISRSNDTLRVAQQTEVSYSWTHDGNTLPDFHDYFCVMPDSVGEYCCTVTSIVPPYCSSRSCYVNHHEQGPIDTCVTLPLTVTPVSCTEVVIEADNQTDSLIHWSSSETVELTPTYSTDSTIAHFTMEGTFNIFAYMVNNGQCYKGDTNITINCIPELAIHYDCNGLLIVYDSSRYNQGTTMPVRTITIEGANTSINFVLTDTNRTASVSTVNLAHGEYTVTMDMDMDIPCSVSKTFLFEGNPYIDSIIIRSKMCANTPFMFTAATVGNINRFRWDFGDGSYNFGDSIYHNYQFSYFPDTVVLSITDSWGCSATDSIEILVGNEILSGDLHPINHVPLCPGIEREINYSPAPLEAHYTWNIDGPTTENNQYYVTETGDYSVLVVTNEYGCKTESRCNVGFLNAPTARISGKSEYCLGEFVKLKGNTGSSNNYLWHISGPENHTFSSPNIKFTPTTAGNYTVILNVTGPDSCTSEATYSFVVHTRPNAPDIEVQGCIHEPPVWARSITGQSLLWSNGVYGVQSGYYTDGYVSAYYIDSTTGCPSERAYEYIEPAPNYDALLTGCYTICPDSLSSDLPVYGFYPYESSDLLWHWFLLGQGEIAHDTTVDPLLPLIDYGTYHMRTEYGNNCLAESPELQIDMTEYCPCDSIELLLEKYQCYVKNCRLYYKLDYTITNNGSSTVVFDHLQVFAGNILVSVNSLPMTIPPGGIRNLEFHVQLSDLMTRTLDFLLVDTQMGCEKRHTEKIYLNTCIEEGCIAEEVMLEFLPDISVAHHTSYFHISFNVPGAVEVVSMWSTPPQVINYTFYSPYNFYLSVDALLMLNYGQLTQMLISGQEVDIYAIVCTENKSLCLVKFYVETSQIMELIPNDYRQLADTTATDSNSLRNLQLNIVVPSADKPYLVPNPAQDEVTVLGIKPKDITEITVLTMEGRQVAVFRNDYRFNINNLARSSYIVRIVTTNKKVHYLKLVKR